MKTRILIGAAAAYACIESSGKSIDVRLARGKSAATSLRETVEELRQKAIEINRRADFIEQHVHMFDYPGAPIEIRPAGVDVGEGV